MCSVTGAVMAALSVAQANEAAGEAQQRAKATNEAFLRNQALQLEAYESDMNVFHEKGIDKQQQKFANADAAAAKQLELSIKGAQLYSSMKMANLESATGKSALRAMGVLRRNLSDRSMDLSDQLEKAQWGIKRDVEGMYYDKIARYNSARGAINSFSMGQYSSKSAKMLSGITSGFGAYAQGVALESGNVKPNPGGERNNILEQSDSSTTAEVIG